MIDKVALVYGQMNEPPGARLRVGLSGLTMAEYFRDEGQDVLLFIDNIFRFVQAGSEVSALLGRMPSAVGYQPTLATEMGQLQERITSTNKGSVTSVQAIYVPADDLTDPAPANTFAHLDATTVLSRAIVEKGIYPAVDPLDSTSRALQPRHRLATSTTTRRRAVQEILQRYKDLQDIIAILGMDELSDEDKLVVAAGAQDRALPLAAELRRRAVHRHAGQVREARGHDRGLPARSSTASTTSCPSRPSTWSARSRSAVEKARARRLEAGRRVAARRGRRRPQVVRRLARHAGRARRSRARPRCSIVPGAAGRSACSRATRRSSRRSRRARPASTSAGRARCVEFATGPGFFKVEQRPRARARRRRGRARGDRRRARAARSSRRRQAELEQVEAGESSADRWQLEQRIRHAENQLAVAAADRLSADSCA